MALAKLGRCCRSLIIIKQSSKVFCDVPQAGWIVGCIGAKRHLLSEDVIKLESFQERKRLTMAHLISETEGNYVEHFGQNLQNNKLILSDELKLLLHLCQTADDMAIAKAAIYRYHAENRSLMHGEFKFGPLFVRLCYELGLGDLAAATLTDKTMNGFFNDTTSFNIALDMLFTKGSYENALEVLRSMKSQGVPFNKDTLTLAFGTYYKLNTSESYRSCSALLEEGKTKVNFIPRRAYCFAVAFALQWNDIDKAQSLYLQIKSTSNRLCQNLKVLMLVLSGQLADAISILSAAILPKSPFVQKPEFSQEVVDVLRMKSEGGPHMLELEYIVTQLERDDQVIQQTVDDLLCLTLPRKKKPIIEERRTSRRTLKPLQPSPWSE